MPPVVVWVWVTCPGPHRCLVRAPAPELPGCEACLVWGALGFILACGGFRPIASALWRLLWFLLDCCCGVPDVLVSLSGDAACPCPPWHGLDSGVACRAHSCVRQPCARPHGGCGPLGGLLAPCWCLGVLARFRRRSSGCLLRAGPALVGLLCERSHEHCVACGWWFVG